ncbi:MAG TPA: 4Fe-4S binding protein [Candidatus Poseidoniaceae archaeon]|nr:MAG TPA: 4Fe-4S dicluster domain-containing protein [Candidatus Poseidoniales archaeon]HII10818.1 4Fe-4S binding protein [Candidatus Poseidoniaceae archaeon]
MGQSMVAIIESDCTGCDLCISHCPFEALLPLLVSPPERTKAKRPVVVVEEQCVGCLSCIGSCPTQALHEIQAPPSAITSPLLHPPKRPVTEKVNRWKKGGLRWA